MCAVTIVGAVLKTLTSVINMIRITSTVLIFRVIVKEVILKGLSQIQKREWWKKLNLFICYGGNFWRQFVCFSFERNPRKKCACVSHEMTQFVLKKEHICLFRWNQPHYWGRYSVSVFYPDYGSWHYIGLSRRQRTFRTCQNASDVD